MLTEDQSFQQVNFAEKPLDASKYEYCQFLHCQLNGVDLSDRSFIDCTFENCDFSMVQLYETAFRNATFKDCKLLGLSFDHCNPILWSASFENCQLNLASFREMKLSGTIFRNCQLEEVDFTRTEIDNAHFDQSNLYRAIFDQSNLENADFRTAQRYAIDPENNRLKGAKFNALGLAGLLRKYNIVIE